MRMIVKFRFMSSVRVIVGSMVSRVIVTMGEGLSIVLMRVLVFVAMLVHVGMGMLMGVNRISMPVLMGMGMSVLMGVQMLVFVIAFHVCLLWLKVKFVCE
jgi:hypothetical protein